MSRRADLEEIREGLYAQVGQITREISLLHAEELLPLLRLQSWEANGGPSLKCETPTPELCAALPHKDAEEGFTVPGFARLQFGDIGVEFTQSPDFGASLSLRGGTFEQILDLAVSLGLRVSDAPLQRMIEHYREDRRRAIAELHRILDFQIKFRGIVPHTPEAGAELLALLKAEDP